MNDVRQRLLEILTRLVRREKLAAERYPEKVQAIRASLTGRGRLAPVEERALTGLFKASQVDLLSKGQFIYLETTKSARWMLPVVSLACDFGKDHADLRLRCGLFSAAPEGDRPVAVGYRFEAPEGDDSEHDFFHAQPIKSFDRDGQWDLPWNPVLTSQPTFALDADNPLALLVCMLVSIYGSRTAREMLTSLGAWGFFKGGLDTCHMHRMRTEREMIPQRTPRRRSRRARSARNLS